MKPLTLIFLAAFACVLASGQDDQTQRRKVVRRAPETVDTTPVTGSVPGELRTHSCPKQLLANLILDRLETLGAPAVRMNSSRSAVRRPV